MTQGESTGAVGMVGKGVPQGSPLSPILFNIYMDKLPKYVNTSMSRSMHRLGTEADRDLIMYADDVKLLARDENVLQTMLNGAKQWAEENNMKWSIEKCVIITPVGDDNGIRLKMGGEPIRNCGTANYLGVSAAAAGAVTDKNVTRIEKACQT